jgi:nucleoside-triphosphatase THEP1
VFARRPGHVDDVWRQLTTEQEIALECLDESRRIVVDGPPGSGKSLLAMAVADRFADRGQRALVLTYTRAIALEMAAIGVRDARPVRDLALDVALELGLATAHEAETWRTPEWNRMMLAVIDALGDGARRPAWLDVDVVVIDEAQDLGELDWQLVDRIVGDRAALWIFQDEEQRVMAHALGVEPPTRIRSTARFRLRTTYRCPAPLVGLATRVRDGDASAIPQAEMEALRASLTVVRIPRGASEELRRSALEAAVEAGLEQEGVGPEDLAIVSLAPARTSRIAGIDALGNRPLRTAVDAPEVGSAGTPASAALPSPGLPTPILDHQIR